MLREISTYSLALFEECHACCFEAVCLLAAASLTSHMHMHDSLQLHAVT
jgi:hypothetical protein